VEGPVSVYFLDTHVVVWLYQKSLGLLSKKALRLIEENNLVISPLVELELEYLLEVGRITEKPRVILEYLQNAIGLNVDDVTLADVVRHAVGEIWTRDPFDRMILAHAKVRNAGLITRDGGIRKHYRKAVF
jgi:PIN domain nuclease of toxin-antitoxin system